MYPHLGECFKTRKILSRSTHFISHQKFGPWPKNDQKKRHICAIHISLESLMKMRFQKVKKGPAPITSCPNQKIPNQKSTMFTGKLPQQN